MCSAQVAESNSAAGLIAPAWRVVSVTPMPGYRVNVRFLDGTAGDVDLSELIARADAGVFASLRDVEIFNAVYVDFGAVTWPNDVDLAPDSMYAAIRADGHYVLR